jgi:hypothetical protein
LKKQKKKNKMKPIMQNNNPVYAIAALKHEKMAERTSLPYPYYTFLLFFICEQGLSQEAPAKKDSAQIHQDIESFSGQHKITRFFYHLIYKPAKVESSTKKNKRKQQRKQIQKPYSTFEGKYIRNIIVETLDPFGYSITDTNATTQNRFLLKGNQIHVKTQNITIRNLLLIHQNQKFDSLLVKESERLVRTRNYILNVSFFIKAEKNDSVDIYIRAIDKWSLIPGFGASASNIKFNLTDKNFIGLGHESANIFHWDFTTGDFAYNVKYHIPNIKNTFINSTLILSKDPLKNAVSGFQIDRPFFSPYARWAAGASYMYQNRHNYLHTADSALIIRHFKLTTQDYWAGSAIHIFKGNSENKRNTNFISTLRFLRIRYLEKPPEIPDVRNIFSNEDFYLAGIGISTRKYVQDRFIFRYGLTEDVPVGKVFSLTGGYQITNNTRRKYFGAHMSFGRYYRWGYLSSAYEYGTFFRTSHLEQGIFSANMIYFTRLMEIGKWKIRQFVKPQFTIGINRLPYDSLTLNDGFGMDGFNSPTLSGISRIMFTLQTQLYTPWNFLGFHFGPFVIFSMGILGNPVTGFRNNKLYSQIALGVLIKNENLIISSFQLSFAYYPIIPGKGHDILKMNSFKTTDFEFSDFEIGKPGVHLYQ